MAKEALSKKDILGASHLIRTLMGEIVGLHHLEQKFSELYSLIIRALPDFQIALSDDQVFCTFAPLQLKNAVSELFLQIKNAVRFAGGEELKDDFLGAVREDS